MTTIFAALGLGLGLNYNLVQETRDIAPEVPVDDIPDNAILDNAGNPLTFNDGSVWLYNG